MLVRLLERMIHRLGNIIGRLDDHISNHERKMTEPHNLNRTCHASTRQEAITLRRYLTPQHEALG